MHQQEREHRAQSVRRADSWWTAGGPCSRDAKSLWSNQRDNSRLTRSAVGGGRIISFSGVIWIPIEEVRRRRRPDALSYPAHAARQFVGREAGGSQQPKEFSTVAGIDAECLHLGGIGSPWLTFKASSAPIILRGPPEWRRRDRHETPVGVSTS